MVLPFIKPICTCYVFNTIIIPSIATVQWIMLTLMAAMKIYCAMVSKYSLCDEFVKIGETDVVMMIAFNAATVFEAIALTPFPLQRILPSSL